MQPVNENTSIFSLFNELNNLLGITIWLKKTFEKLSLTYIYITMILLCFKSSLFCLGIIFLLNE